MLDRTSPLLLEVRMTSSSLLPAEHDRLQRPQPAPASPAPHHHFLPPLHGVTIATSDTMPMTAPFTVPYNRDSGGEFTTPSLAFPLPPSGSPLSSPPPPSPSDGMAAKMAAGGLSCMLISAVFNPMDVVKIRLQTQNQLHSGTAAAASSAAGVTATAAAPAVSLPAAARSPSAASPVALSMYADSKYKGMTHGLITIYREEGYCRGLMRGSAALQPSLHGLCTAALHTAQALTVLCCCCAVCLAE